MYISCTQSNPWSLRVGNNQERLNVIVQVKAPRLRCVVIDKRLKFVLTDQHIVSFKKAKWK